MKTCLITGANSGIGKEMAAHMAREGAVVVMVCRDAVKADAAARDIRRATANEHVETIVADLSVLGEVRRVADEFRARHERIDVLINNAGAIHKGRVITADGLETTFALNHLAYFVLTDLLLDLVKAAAPSRIVNVSSGAHSGAKLDMNDLQLERGYTDIRAYCNSKLMNLLFTYELARRLEGTGVTVNTFNPGGVNTGFGKKSNLFMRAVLLAYRPFMRTPVKGAETGNYLATSDEVAGVSGRYFYDCTEVASTALSHDRDIQSKLWEISAQLSGGTK